MTVRFVQTILAANLLGMLASVPASEPASTGDSADQTQEEMCKHTECQHNVRITLRKKDGSTYDQTFDVLPGSVQPIGLVIVSGQTLYFEADVQGDKLTGFRIVDAVSHPERTLVAKLQQSEAGMLLTVTNPFKRPLKFDMGIMPLERPSLFKTSSCPIVPGGTSFESWPEPIFQVVLGNARFVEAKGGGVVCN